jgi:hypothetical protein
LSDESIHTCYIYFLRSKDNEFFLSAPKKRKKLFAGDTASQEKIAANTAPVAPGNRFRESESGGEHDQHDIPLSEDKTVRVSVYLPDNVGKAMATDDPANRGREACHPPQSRNREDRIDG